MKIKKTELEQINDVKRLLTLEKIEIKNALYYIQNRSMYDINDVHNKLNEILSINLVILKKINEK